MRVYPPGDPRSFFLVWNGCSPTACGTYPTGTWQRTELVRSLSIQQAESNPPPARLADVPPDAPIIGIHLRASYSFGQPWHGFVDNVTLGFAVSGRPTNDNFELEAPSLNTASLTLTSAQLDPLERCISKARRTTARPCSATRRVAASGPQSVCDYGLADASP